MTVIPIAPVAHGTASKNTELEIRKIIQTIKTTAPLK